MTPRKKSKKFQQANENSLERLHSFSSAPIKPLLYKGEGFSQDPRPPIGLPKPSELRHLSIEGQISAVKPSEEMLLSKFSK